MPTATAKAVLHRRCPAVHSHGIIDTVMVAATCTQASHQELGVAPPLKSAGLFSLAGLAHLTLGSVLAPKGIMGIGPSLATLVQLMRLLQNIFLPMWALGRHWQCWCN